MLPDETKVLMCMPWKLRSPLAEGFNVKLQCSVCEQDVCVDKSNVVRAEKEGYVLVCLECAMNPDVIPRDDIDIGGAMVGGQLFTDAIKTLETIEEKIQQSKKDQHEN